jgi:anti-sigma factor RsiW
MCPDRQILSLYFDGELPSPWKEKMEAHLESCAGCRARLETYRSFSLASGIIGEDEIGAAKDRVWNRLAAPPPVNPAESGGLFPGGEGFWNRRVTLPLPAAAAIFIIIAFFAILALKPQGAVLISDTPPVASVIDMDVSGIAPVSDMSGVLQYLSSQDTSEFVIIRLPESRSFSRFGEPALLKAADYSGNSSPGRTAPR